MSQQGRSSAGQVPLSLWISIPHAGIASSQSRPSSQSESDRGLVRGMYLAGARRLTVDGGDENGSQTKCGRIVQVDEMAEAEKNLIPV